MQQIPIQPQTASRVIEDGVKPTSLPNGLLDVETERRQLDLQIAGLRHELERVQKRRNDLAPCFKLPMEVLSRVFSYVRDMCSEYDQSPKRRLAWIDMAGVCQLWRAVVLDLSQLWTDIDLFKNAEWIQKSLERSRQASLNVSIPSAVKASNEPQLLATLEQLHRFRILRLCVPDSQVYSKTRFMKDLSVVFDKISSTVTPLLETLVLTHVYDFMADLDDITHPPFAVAEAPNLRHLEILGWRLPWSSSLFSGLTSLKITSPGSCLHGTIEELFQTLGRLPELKELYLSAKLPQGTEASLRSQTIRFQHLDSIILRGGIEDAIVIFRHIAIPVSAHICINSHFHETPSLSSSKTSFRDLISSLTSAWLSGQISESSSTPRTKYGVRSLEIEGDSEGLTIRGWMDNVDHAMRHAQGNPYPSEDSSIPPASLTINVELYAVDPPWLLRAFLSTFPLHKLKSIYLDIQPTKGGWDALAKLSSLQSISLTRYSAVDFYNYVYSDPIMEAFSDFSGETQLELDPELASVTRFRNLAHLSFESVNFGLGEYAVPTDIKAIDWYDFYELLMYRCELNVPIHHLRFSKCINLWETDVIDARGVVSDVFWDGYMAGRDESTLQAERENEAQSESESDEG